MRNKRHILAVVIGLFVLIPGFLAAQTRELRIGTWATGNLSPGQVQRFSVRAAETGFLTVETSGDLDTYLRVYDSGNNILGENDDGGENYNARMEIIASAGSTYFFDLSFLSSEQAGPYRLIAGSRPIPRATELRIGSLVSGNINAGDEIWYSVRPTSDGFLTVETMSNIDTYIYAYDSNYALLGYDDDGGDGGNAKFSVFAEPGRTYYFRVRGYSDHVTGPYRVIASLETVPADTARNTERSRAVNLQVGGNAVIFFRSPNESRWYRCTFPHVNNLLSAHTEGDVGTSLTLYDSRGNIIREGYGHVLAPSSDGTIFIEVKAYDGRQGRTTLFAELRESRPDQYEPDNTMSTAKDITVGERQIRTFTDSSDEDWARLRITRTDFYYIGAEAMSEDYGRPDCYIELYDSNGELIDSDDDGGRNLNSLLRIRLTPGTYFIKARCFSSGVDLLDNRYILSVEVAVNGVG